MAPRNILLNVVEGDKSLLAKAQAFFMAACYPVVGYKQIANFLKMEGHYCKPITVIATEYCGSEDDTIVEEVTPVLPGDNTVYFDGEGKALYVLPQPFSRWSQVDKIAYYTKLDLIEEEQKQLPPEEKQGATMTQEEIFARMSKILGRTIKITKPGDSKPVVPAAIKMDYQTFYTQLTSELRLVPKRSKEDVQTIMKNLYTLHKDKLSSKESVRNLIISLSDNFDHYATYIRSNSKFIPMHRFITDCADLLYKQNMTEDDLPF